MNPLMQLILSQMPGIIAEVKKVRVAQDPNAPTITSEQVIAAFEKLFQDSLMKDQILKAELQAEIDAR